MPSLPEGDHTREQEPSQSYYQAARFEREQLALAAYTALQEAIASVECDLSTYRFLLNQVSHIAVLGQQPVTELEQALHAILAAGEAVTLPDNVLNVLLQRRSQATRQGSWVEGHYRPGVRLSEEVHE